MDGQILELVMDQFVFRTNPLRCKTNLVIYRTNLVIFTSAMGIPMTNSVILCTSHI